LKIPFFNKIPRKTGGRIALPVFLLLELAWWFLVFLLGRIVFLIFNIEKIDKSSNLEILQSLVSGWKVDLSMAAYFLSISLLILVHLADFREDPFGLDHQPMDQLLPPCLL
jgi:hypothetical protein